MFVTLVMTNLLATLYGAHNVLLPMSPFRPVIFTLVGAIAGEEISFGKGIIFFGQDFDTRILSGILVSITSLWYLIRGAGDKEKQNLIQTLVPTAFLAGPFILKQPPSCTVSQFGPS
jgi:hypothetical protein